MKGSETLLTRMVANVIDNAVTHNQPGGWLRVTSEAEGALARLVVENGGAVLTQADVENWRCPSGAWAQSAPPRMVAAASASRSFTRSPQCTAARSICTPAATAACK